MGQVSHIPDNYQVITPYLVVRGAAEAVAFYVQAFGATEVMRLTMPDGRLGHAEVEIAGSRVMLADEFPEREIRGPASLGGSTVSLNIYVEDVDARFAQALEAGATELNPVQDQFYGDRSGTLVDPFGHRWTLATHIKEVPPEEVQRYMDEVMAKATPDCA